MSTILKPSIQLEDRFIISKMMALSVCDLLDSLSVEQIQIKWPNDILINREKIAGILIENSIQGTLINSSVLGLGLNVNQEKFNIYRRKATSLKLITGKDYVVEDVLSNLAKKIEDRYSQLKLNPSKIHQDYLNQLYGYGIAKKYKDADGEFAAVIESVMPDGQIRLLKNGSLVNYDLKEIQFMD